MNKTSYKSISQEDYWLLHAWLRRNYGKATHCENKCGTKAKVFDWALIHGKRYERNRNNFKMLCKKCHYYYDDLKTVGVKHPMWGRHHTDEAKRKIGLASLGNKNCLGNKLSLETKLKMSLSRRGVPKTKEHREKIGLANKGKILSKETKRKLRLAHLGKKASIETRRKMIISRTGTKKSLETRERMKKAALLRWARLCKAYRSAFVPYEAYDARHPCIRC